MSFRLEDFKNGQDTKTVDGEKASFVCVLSGGIPAPLLVEVNGVMENYYMDGTYRAVPPSGSTNMDLTMNTYFDR